MSKAKRTRVGAIKRSFMMGRDGVTGNVSLLKLEAFTELEMAMAVIEQIHGDGRLVCGHADLLPSFSSLGSALCALPC
jgi:hypothetical protein